MKQVSATREHATVFDATELDIIQAGLTRVMAGISREHLSRIESGKVAVTEEMKTKLLEALEKFNPDAPLTMLFDYVKIRFPTLDIQHIIKDILKPVSYTHLKYGKKYR